MKQLLFLLLFPCLALAQYTGNAGQKITLGEQTTADGLVWRGRLADTANLLTNKLDTSVYIVLDTGTRAMWYYRASTTPKWTRLVDSLNNLQGTLSVAKGGTGSTTQNFVDLTTTQSIAGVKTFSDTLKGNTASFINNTSGNNLISLQSNDQSRIRLRFNNTGASGRIYSIIGGLAGGNNSSFTIYDETASATRFEIKSNGSVNFQNSLSVTNTASNPSLTAGATAISTYTPLGVGTQLVFGSSSDYPFCAWLQNRHTSINDLPYPIGLNPSGGSVGIGTTDPTEKLHVVGNGLFTGNVTATRFNPTSSTASGTGMYLPATNTLGFSINSTTRFLISPLGNLSTDSISKTTATYKTFELGKGVGTTVMAGRLDGLNEFALGVNFYYDGGSNLEYISNGFSTYYSQNNGTHRFYTAPSGNAGANITYTESMRLKSDSELQIAGTTDRGAYNLQVNGTGVWGEGAYVNGSDANIKENIVDLDSSLNIVNNLKPVSFNYINTSVNNDTKHLGFIAQDVYQILENKDYLNSIVRSDGETLSIAYSNLIPILTKAIQEQQALIKTLEQRILTLENK